MEIDALNGNICMFFRRKEHRKKYFPVITKRQHTRLGSSKFKGKQKAKKAINIGKAPEGLI
jgi:hypothetical protein